MIEGILSPEIYPEIVKSVPFTREIMQTNIVTEKSNGKPITLYAYYAVTQYQHKNVLGSIKKYTVGLPGLIVGSFRKENPIEGFAGSTDLVAVYSLNKEEKKGVNKSYNRFRVFLHWNENGTGLLCTFVSVFALIKEDCRA